MNSTAWGRLALLGAVLLAGCEGNGQPCVEVTHTRYTTPPTWPRSGVRTMVYDSSYKHCGPEVTP